MTSVELGGIKSTEQSLSDGQSTETPLNPQLPAPKTKPASSNYTNYIYKQGYNGPMDIQRAEIYQNELLIGS